MKRVGRILMLLIMISVVISSCKKDNIDIPESNDPVFRTDGTIGTTPFSIVAGDNGAYMYTMTDIENGVEVFSGKMSDGSLSVELGIYDGLVDKPGYSALEGLTSSNFLNFAYHDSNTVYLTLSKNLLVGLNSVGIQSIAWYVDDVLAGYDEVEIYEPGVYNVCAHVTFTDNNTATLCNQLIAGYSRNANCTVQVSLNQQGFINASLENPGFPIDNVKWFIDGNFITENSGTLMSALTPDMHELKAEVYFSNGVKRVKALIFDGSNSLHFVNDFSVFEYQALPFIQDFNARLRIKHDNKEYDSELVDNSNSSIIVTGLEYYGKNSSGNNVYKVTADVSAVLREVGTTKNVNVQFTTVFGVEIQ